MADMHELLKEIGEKSLKSFKERHRFGVLDFRSCPRPDVVYLETKVQFGTKKRIDICRTCGRQHFTFIEKPN